MAFRTWARLLLLAVGAGAVVATSQLGLAYGLGIVRLARPFTGPAADQWPAQLTWFAWFAMISATAGTWVAGQVVRRNPGNPSGPGVDAGLAAAAALGACVVVPLAMQPARTALVDGTDTVFVAGITALLGAIVGGAAGYAALTWWTARSSLAISAAAMWLLAIVSVLPSLRVVDPLPAVRLGGIDLAVLSAVTTQRFALFTMPAVALVAGALLGWLARRRELGQIVVATAGLAGPALLAAAYLIGGPGGGDQRYQSVPYWSAIGAAFAGMLGSVLAGMIRRADDTPPEAPDAGEIDPTTAFAGPGPLRDDLTLPGTSDLPPGDRPGDGRFGPGQPDPGRFGPDQPGGDRFAPSQAPGGRFGPDMAGGRFGPDDHGGDRFEADQPGGRFGPDDQGRDRFGADQQGGRFGPGDHGRDRFEADQPGGRFGIGRPAGGPGDGGAFREATTSFRSVPDGPPGARFDPGAPRHEAPGPGVDPRRAPDTGRGERPPIRGAFDPGPPPFGPPPGGPAAGPPPFRPGPPDRAPFHPVPVRPDGSDPELSDLFARGAPSPGGPPADPPRGGMSSLRRRRPPEPVPDGFGAAPDRGEPVPRPRTGGTGPAGPVPKRDVDYVDWVAGLNDD